MTKTVLVASHNPVKINACRIGFRQMFPGESFEYNSISVPSGVKDQPTSDQETLTGAINRSAQAMTLHTDANFWVGIEGGVETYQGALYAFAWIVIRDLDHVGKSRTGTFMLPEQVRQLVDTGKELGEADDIVFKRQNTKQDNGAVGLLTENIIVRSSLYAHAVVLALIPFKNQELYHTPSRQEDALQ